MGLGSTAHRAVSQANDPKRLAQATCYRRRLEGFARTSETERLLDLWLRQAAIALDGASADLSVDERRAAIQAEARRLWPGSDWQMAALL